MASNKEKAAARAERARVLQEEQRRRDRHRNLVRGGLVAVVLVLIVVVGLLIGQLHGDKVDTDAAAGDSDYSLVLGPDSAPHKVIIYEDFQCPYCDALENATRDTFASQVAAGTLQVDYRPFDLLGGGNPDSYTVRSTSAFALVQQTSGDEVAKKFHDLLYENQPSEAGPFPSNDDILKLAVQAGADETKVKDGIENPSQIDWVSQATDFAANTAKVSSTPTILLDGKQFTDGSSADDLAKNLMAAVAS